MQKRKTLLVAALLTILCVAIAVPANAGYTSSFLYSKFNTLDWQEYKLDQTYNHLSVDARNYLTYNVTGTWAKIAFMNQSVANDGAGDPQGIELLFSDGVTVKVFVIDGFNEVQIAAGTYIKGTESQNASRVHLTYSGGKVTVYTDYGTKTQTKILDGFSFDYPITHMRIKGSDLHTAQDGYMQVDVNAGTAGATGEVTDIAMSFIPMIVLFAMLGILLGLLKKFGKI